MIAGRWHASLVAASLGLAIPVAFAQAPAQAPATVSDEPARPPAVAPRPGDAPVAPSSPGLGTGITPGGRKAVDEATNAVVDATLDKLAPEGPIEQTRRSVRTGAEWLARKVDSWFGDKPFGPGSAVSDGQLGVSLLLRQHERPQFRLRFNAKFRLPNVEERGYVFIGRDNPREVVTDTPGEVSRAERLITERTEDRSFFAGLGLDLRDYVDLRVGVRHISKPYVQMRFRRSWELGARDRIEFRETLFWILDDRFGSTTAVTYEHVLGPTLAVRWVNAITMAERDRKFDWTSVVALYKSYGEHRLLSVAALVGGRTQQPEISSGEYGVLVKWEQPVYRDWLLGELSVGRYHWRRTNVIAERGQSWALGYGLKMRF